MRALLSSLLIVAAGSIPASSTQWVVTDVSAEFTAAWVKPKGERAKMPIDPDTAKKFMQLNWIGWGPCNPPECEP